MNGKKVINLNHFSIRLAMPAFIALTLVTFTSYAQVKEASKNLKQQAVKMGSAFVDGDYEAFAN